MTVEGVAVLPISVVIPTLGGPTLDATLDQLNSGEERPAEILVCVPLDEWGSRPVWRDSNIRVLTLPFRGQVRQRAAGFIAASQPYVMQLDDDLLLQDGGLRSLLETLEELGPSAAVAPAFVRPDGRGHARYPKGVRGFLLSLATTLLHGAPWGVRRMGAVGRSGQSFGVDPDNMSGPVLEVEWLQGGCILHRKENVVTQDFFPFAGKAYSEDLLHSQLLREHGIRLWTTREARCVLETAPENYAFAERRHKLQVERYVCRQRGVGVTWRGMRLTVSLVRDAMAVARRAAVRLSRWRKGPMPDIGGAS